MAIYTGGTSGVDAFDPYAGMRGKVNKELKAIPRDPLKNPMYNAYLPVLQENINSDYASRGLGDSGLAADANTRAQTGLYADIYNQTMQHRAGLLNTLSGMPRQYIPGGAGPTMGGSGAPGWGTVSFNTSYDQLNADRAYGLAMRQNKQAATQDMYARGGAYDPVPRSYGGGGGSMGAPSPDQYSDLL